MNRLIGGEDWSVLNLDDYMEWVKSKAILYSAHNNKSGNARIRFIQYGNGRIRVSRGINSPDLYDGRDAQIAINVFNEAVRT